MAEEKLDSFLLLRFTGKEELVGQCTAKLALEGISLLSDLKSVSFKELRDLQVPLLFVRRLYDEGYLSDSPRTREAPADSCKCQKIVSPDDIADPKVLLWISDGPERRLAHMGRTLTKEIVDFINVKRSVYDYKILKAAPDEKVPKEEARTVEEAGLYGIRYITGPPGTGKSTSLKMAVNYLSELYGSERPVRRGIVQLDGNQFVSDPRAAISAALLETGTTVAPDGVFAFMMNSKVRYTIVVDDGNKIPPLSSAAIFLASLVRYCSVVLCASVSSEWTDVLRKPKTHHYKLVTKGLEGTELERFCAIYDIDRKLLDMSKTGTNPRLMLTYMNDIEEFGKLIKGLEVEATEFLKKVVNSPERDDILTAMTGMRKNLMPLDRIIDSKCFYVAKDGSLECITDGLRAFCSVKLKELIKERQLTHQLELI